MLHNFETHLQNFVVTVDTQGELPNAGRRGAAFK